MKKWSNGAKKRLVEIRAAEDREQDMRAMLEEALKENSEYKNLIASLSEVYENVDT